tara:strand:- start:951 stop:1073 length:123 start_codon:yes stop_codon:yes gene_type:complete
MKNFKKNLHVYAGYLVTGAIIMPCLAKLTAAVILGQINDW